MALALNTTIHAFVHADNTGRSYKIPVIVVEGQGLLVDHLNYLISRKRKGKTWRTNSVQSVTMFMDFMLANHNRYLSATEAFKGFVDGCLNGTRDEGGYDGSGLYWNSKSRQRATLLIKHLTMFADYLAESKGEESLRLNPYRQATRHDQLLELAAYYHRKNNSFLGHLKNEFNIGYASSKTREISIRGLKRHSQEEVKAFPRDSVDLLITEGFIKRNVLSTSPVYKRVDLGDVLITYLMAYGGLRVSEPFHIYLDDVTRDKDGKAIVKVYHPEEGLAPGGERGTRKQFLAKSFGMLPRSDENNAKRDYAGWKESATLPGGFFYVNWFPQSAGIEFYQLFKLYVEKVRFSNTTFITDKCTYQLKEGANHPFLFVDRNGRPKSYAKYLVKFAAAVKRIGLKVEKMLGTTPHGLRHRYAQELENNDIDGPVITKSLHHKSYKSKDVYTEADQQQINVALKEGTDRIVRNF